MDLQRAVVVATYLNHETADAAASLLASEGVDAMVLADDAGGELPSLDVLTAIRLVVQPQDEEFARELLHAEPEG